MSKQNTNITELIHSYKDDPELAATLNIEELLNALENEKNEHLDNKTLENIAEEKYKQLKKIPHINSDKIKELFSKLAEYRHIDEIYQLHRGKHVRWIRLNSQPPTLTNGGIVVDIKFLDTGTHILVLTKNPKRKCIQYKFDESITFQKLSTDEQLILAAYELIQK